jgi:transcriptional regulator with XRE-family HTH domain
MAPHTYGEVLARNLRAARSRIDIGQESVAARMRALGYTAWLRQTVGSTERGRRRPTAEEVFALAYVLQTSVPALMAPTAEDEVVDLPSGLAIDASSAYRSAYGTYDHALYWDGDEPVVHPVFGGTPDEGRVPRWPPYRDTPGMARRIRELEEQVAVLQQGREQPEPDAEPELEAGG